VNHPKDVVEVAHPTQGVFHVRLVLFRAQEDANRQVLACFHLLGLEIVQVEIHRSGICVAKTAQDPIQSHQALEPLIVKQQIDPSPPLLYLLCIHQTDDDPFAQGLGVAGYGSDGGIVDLAIFQAANHGTVHAGALGQVG
jgi:hypothetical protein